MKKILLALICACSLMGCSTTSKTTGEVIWGGPEESTQVAVFQPNEALLQEAHDVIK